MKKIDLIFSAILVPIDYAMLVLAGISAYFLRYQSWVQEIRPVIFNLNFKEYLDYVWLSAVAWIFIFILAGLYRTSRTKIFDEFNRIFLACSTGILLVIVSAFFSRELFDSRFILLAVWILTILYIFIFRLIIRHIQQMVYKHGKGVHKIILIGSTTETQKINHEFSQQKKLGYQVVETLEKIDISQLEKIIKQQKIDEIILLDNSVSRSAQIELYNFCQTRHLIFKYTADFLQTSNLELTTLVGLPIIEVKKTKLDGWWKILKRLIDLIFSFFGLIVLSPVFLILAIVVKTTSRGPVFYASQRIGEHGTTIRVWKFRSMIQNAEKLKNNLLSNNERADGPLFKMKNDPRITPFGKFIRRWSLDELPQLWNVLKGDMSLVGPRPHETHEVEKYKTHHHKLLNIKPGMTGMAQVSGRSELSFEEETRLDTFYIENWSPRLDLIILIKTPIVVFMRQGAE